MFDKQCLKSGHLWLKYVIHGFLMFIYSLTLACMHHKFCLCYSIISQHCAPSHKRKERILYVWTVSSMH